LLKAGANPNTLSTDEGETVLMTASRAGKADIVKLLLDAGANPNAKEAYKGQTALMWAAAEGHPAVVKELLAH
jgi:ankyrin repeat protein